MYNIYLYENKSKYITDFNTNTQDSFRVDKLMGMWQMTQVGEVKRTKEDKLKAFQYC